MCAGKWVCVTFLPVALPGVKTMTKLRYLIPAHTHTGAHTDRAVNQTRAAETKCKRETRRLLRLAAATCCFFCCSWHSAATAFNMAQFAESSGRPSVVWIGRAEEGAGAGAEPQQQQQCCQSNWKSAHLQRLSENHCLLPPRSIKVFATYACNTVACWTRERPRERERESTCMTANLRVSFGFALRHFVCATLRKVALWRALCCVCVCCPFIHPCPCSAWSFIL